MLRKVLAFVAIALLFISAGCSSSPVSPDRDMSVDEYFNQYDLSNPVVGEYTYTDLQGNVLSSGTLGRTDDGLYVIQSRGAQVDIDVTPLNLVDVMVTYNNPAGTIASGPNAGLPYYYVNQTINYDINVVSYFWEDIGGPNGFGSGLADLTAIMKYASFNTGGVVVAGAPLPGDSTYSWQGVISPGYMVINDDFTIVPGTSPGLDVTTVRIEAPIFFGLFDVVFFDGIAGVWDPVD